MKYDIDNETLLQYWHNANVTYAECGGHNKAEHNKTLAIEYEAEMLRRGMAIPADQYAGGKFNGEGSH